MAHDTVSYFRDRSSINFDIRLSYFLYLISETPLMLKYLGLFLLTSENALGILIQRYVLTRGGDMFMVTSAVIMAEILKFSVCLLIILYQQHFSLQRWFTHLHENIILQPVDCLKMSVPSLIYTLQNNLQYLALSNLDAATFQVGDH